MTLKSTEMVPFRGVQKIVVKNAARLKLPSSNQFTRSYSLLTGK